METPSSLSASGALFFDETGEWIGPETTLASFETTKLRALTSVQVGVDKATCKLAERRLFGASFNVTLTFVGERLRRVDMFPNRPDDAKGWDGWTHESEMTRKTWAEEWAARIFGKPLGIKPIVLPDLPEPIYPAKPTPEHPRHALFDWGEVASYYDSKAGFAGLWIHYNAPS